MRQVITTQSARAKLRTWPLDPSIGHLVIVDVSMIPTTEQVEGWLDDAYAPPTTTAAEAAEEAAASTTSTRAVRTGALYPAAAAVFADCGFTVIDRLVLLERDLLDAPAEHRNRPATSASLRRVRRRDLTTLAQIDQSAFPDGWRNDATSLSEIANATPSARSRLADLGGRSDSRGLGFAITGKAGMTGYLQRIAVRPDAQRRGVGHQLVDDALGWLVRRGANRALVNTGVDNVAALRMYEQASFERLDDHLVVLEHRRTP